MDFIPVDLIHKEKIDKYIKAQRIESSELTFLTMYIWRKSFNIHFAEHSGCIIFSFRDNNYPPSLRFPLGGGDKKSALRAACDSFLEKGFAPRIYGLTKDMVQELKSLCPGDFELKPMRDYFDYVYDVKKLISLSGKTFHSKRNQYK